MGEAEIEELLRINDDVPWEYNFQFRPLAIDVPVLTELARLPFFNSSRASMTAGACKPPIFQSLSVALQPANVRMFRSSSDLESPLSLLLQLPGSAT
jgi:hypothetical protein